MKRVLLLLVVACGGGQTKSTVSNSVADGDPASCSKVADHITDQMTADENVEPAEVKRLHDLFAKHCDQDLWSADLRKCIVETKDPKGSDRCNSMITEGQKAAFEKDVAKHEPASQPAAAAPAPPEMKEETKTRGAAHKGGDPCEGGE